MDLKKIVRDIPDFPKPGIIFKDITPLLNDPPAFKFIVDSFAERYRGKKIDVIVGIESRGFLFGSTLAYLLGKSFAIARKKGKLPYARVSHTYKLEYGEDTIELHEDAIKKGDRVLVIDDLLATGGTAGAAAHLVEKMGGKVEELAFVIELEFLNGRKVLGDYPVFSLVQY